MCADPGTEVATLNGYDPDEAAERLYGAVAEDEGLRGELDDSGYAPLVAWAAERADALAAEASYDVDVLAKWLHDAVACLVAASQSGDPERLTAIASDIIPAPDLERLKAGLSGASNDLANDSPGDPNQRAARLAAVLSGSGGAPGTGLAGEQTPPTQPTA